MKYVVNVPVADLRREPTQVEGYYDLLQETQVLYNEPLKGHKINNGWVFVEAIEQQKHDVEKGWSGYPGWVRAEHLIEVNSFPSPNLCVITPWACIEKECGSELEVSMGTKLEGVEELDEKWVLKLPQGSSGTISKKVVKAARSNQWGVDLVNRGKQLIDSPYFWGGRSAYKQGLKKQLTSVDCSSLVNLLYQTEWQTLPRDAHDQFLRCSRIESSQMKPGDLIFLAPAKKQNRISHVMIFVEEDLFLEAEWEAQKVRLVSSINKLGLSMKGIPWGYNNGEYCIYFSSLTEK